MKMRTLLFLLALCLLSAFVMYGVTVWLPEHGVSHSMPLWRGPAARLGGELSPGPGRAILPAPGSGQRSLFWMGPFGLHRMGVPGVWWYLGSFVSLLILAAMALFAAPRRVNVVAQVISGGWGQRALALTIGILAYLGLVLLALLLFVNIVGWPILMVIGLGAYLATAIGLVAVALALGSGVSRGAGLQQAGPLFRLLVGALLLFLGSSIPYVGWLVVGFAAALGFGAVAWTRFGDTRGWTLDDVTV